MKKELSFLLIYFGLVVGFGLVGELRDVSAIDWFLWLPKNIWLVVGGIVGYNFVFVEKLWQVFYLFPQQTSSLWVRQYLQSVLKTKKITKPAEFINYLYRTDFSGIGHSTLNSLLFHLAWIVVGFFTITSTNVSFGQGLVMGLGFYLVYNSVISWRESWQKFYLQTFWMVQRQLTQAEVKTYFYLFISAFILLTLFFI